MADLIRKIPGVVTTRVGYSGGDVANATYRNHGTHAEAIVRSIIIAVALGTRTTTSLARPRHRGVTRDPAAAASRVIESRLKRAFQEPQDRWCRGRPVAADLAVERIARPEVAGARDDEPAHVDSSLVKGVLEGLRLRRWIDDIVCGAVD